MNEQSSSCRDPLTVSRGVSQQFANLLVGGVLSQSAHDVSDLVVSHLVVTHPVEQTEGLLVVCGVEREEDISIIIIIIVVVIHMYCLYVLVLEVK